MTRDELIEELNKDLFKDTIYIPGGYKPVTAEMLADFIIEDRKRIVEPLVKYNKCYPSYAAMKAINHTLKNAGVI